jgi:hypothetical protein
MMTCRNVVGSFILYRKLHYSWGALLLLIAVNLRRPPVDVIYAKG